MTAMGMGARTVTATRTDAELDAKLPSDIRAMHHVSVGLHSGAVGIQEARPAQNASSLAPRSVRRPRLTLQVNPGSRYRCGRSD